MILQILSVCAGFVFALRGLRTTRRVGNLSSLELGVGLRYLTKPSLTFAAEVLYRVLSSAARLDAHQKV